MYDRTILEHKTPATFCTAPGAIVLRQMANGEFATHWRNDENPLSPYYVTGHYFTYIEAARRDYEARVKRGF